MKLDCLRISPIALMSLALVACDDGEDGTHEHGAGGTTADAAAELPDTEGCEHMVEGPSAAVTAGADAASAGAIADDHTRYDVTFVDLAGGQKGGAVTFAADETGDFHFFFDAAVPYQVADAAGTVVEIEESSPGTEACTEIKQWDIVELAVGTYTLTFGPTDATGVKIVVEHGGEAHDHEH
jgi:hypothetical protein